MVKRVLHRSNTGSEVVDFLIDVIDAASVGSMSAFMPKKVNQKEKGPTPNEVYNDQPATSQTRKQQNFKNSSKAQKKASKNRSNDQKRYKKTQSG